MDDRGVEEILAAVPLFKLLDPIERAGLAKVFDRQDAASGQVIFNAGEPGDSLYIVVSGTVELSVRDTTGSRIVLAECRRGDFFGELSLLDGGARTATATAVSPGDLLVLDREDLMTFLRAHPDAALDLLTIMGERLRTTDALVRSRVSRNINEEMETLSTPLERFADTISEFAGSLTFLALNALWFGFWIVWHVLPGVPKFDPYPFGFLTMAVSLEAIFLSIFVLVSQNRQGAKDRLRADLDYQVNLKAELEIAHLHEKVEFLTEELLARLPRQPRTTLPGTVPKPEL